MWWLIWRHEEQEEWKAYSFKDEPSNEDILSSSENGFNMVGYPVEADTEEEAIILAIASDD